MMNGLFTETAVLSKLSTTETNDISKERLYYSHNDIEVRIIKDRKMVILKHIF